MGEINLSQKLYRKANDGTVEFTVEFKTKGDMVTCTCTKRGVLEKKVECPVDIAKELYRRFIDTGYRKNTFVLNIPVE